MNLRWAWNVCDDTFAAHVSNFKPDLDVHVVSSQDRAFCYADFLVQFDQTLAEDLYLRNSEWLEKVRTPELTAIGSEPWDIAFFTTGLE